MARDIARAVVEVLGPQPGQSQYDNKPYAFVGHAFGAVVAHETALVMCEKECFSCIATPLHTERPMLLVAVSSEGPTWEGRSTGELHTLPLPALGAELQRLGGDKGIEELFADPILVETFLPILQADFQLEETYRCSAERHSLPFPILAVCGTKPGRDRQKSLVRIEDVRLWSACSKTERTTRVIELPEHDFYMLEDAAGVEAVLKVLNEHFSRYVAPLMPWAKIACQTSPTPDSLQKAAAQAGGGGHAASSSQDQRVDGSDVMLT